MTSVMIISGGYATRLGNLALDCPKILQPISGVPFLEHLLRSLTADGFTRFHFCLGHLGDQVEAYLAERGFAYSVSYDPPGSALGTGGALAAGIAACVGDSVLVLMGDTYFSTSLRPMLDELPPRGAVMAVTSEPSYVSPNVTVESGAVVRYVKQGIPGTTFTDAGALLVSADLLPHVADRGTPFGLEVIIEDLVARCALRAFGTGACFFDIGTPSGLRRLERAMATW